jgi:LytS/YehU family sensor histidine kinase
MYYEMFYYISIWQKESKLNQSLEIENVKSQLHLLKRQLSPHFLFNSLSTLSSLIETNKDEALSFLDRFSDAYRYLLTHDDEVLSSLISELDFVEIYISILKSNYGNALNFTINVDRNLSKLTVPTLSL